MWEFFTVVMGLLGLLPGWAIDALGAGVEAFLLVLQAGVWVIKHPEVIGWALMGLPTVVVVLLDQHVLNLHLEPEVKRPAATLLREGGRLTAVTVSVLGHVVPTELAATSTGRTQRVLGAGVSSDLLAVYLHVTEVGAAAVTAAMSGGIVPTAGRHLPAPSGEPIRGVSGYRVPSGTPPPSVFAQCCTARLAVQRCPSGNRYRRSRLLFPP